jgi:hypothetical protein
MNSSLSRDFNDEHFVKLSENPSKFGFYFLMTFIGLCLFLSPVFWKVKNNHVKIFFTCTIILLFHFGTPPIFLGLLCIILLLAGHFK